MLPWVEWVAVPRLAVGSVAAPRLGWAVAPSAVLEAALQQVASAPLLAVARRATFSSNSQRRAQSSEIRICSHQSLPRLHRRGNCRTHHCSRLLVQRLPSEQRARLEPVLFVYPVPQERGALPLGNRTCNRRNSLP